MTLPEKNQHLINSYLRLNDEGRGILDMALNKLKQIHGENDIKKVIEGNKHFFLPRRDS